MHLRTTEGTVGVSDDESKELSTLQTALQDYVLQQQARWVTNQGDIESEWEGYLAQLETMGVERYVQIYQDATDRYYGK